MKLFGTAYFSLAVFSLWSTTASAQESVGTTTTSTRTQAPSESTLTTSTASTSTGSTSVSSSNSTSQTTTSFGTVLSTAKNSSFTTGTTRSLLPSPETAATKLTPTAIGPNTNIPRNVTQYQIHPESTSGNTTQSQPDSTGSDSANTEQVLDAPSYTSIILPVIIALIVITFSVCILGALYRICWKTTPERQENETEHTSLDKENVKLISVKTTSPESGEHSSQGKNKTRQHDDSSSHLGNKCNDVSIEPKKS